MKPNIAIYGDFQNVRTSPENIKFLHEWFNQKGNISINKYYANWSKENDQFAQALHQKGCKIIHVPSGEKNAVDHEIMGDCKNDILSDRSIRIVILITGDKDYLPLVKELQNLGIKVILIHGNNVSQRLKEAVDETYSINQLIASVNPAKATPEKLDSSTILPYEEGKNYLIYFIKTVQAEGKKATLALIGNFLKKHPRLSGYKKVSYCRPDGKIVSKFSKFVEAVIQEGIIKKNRNGELTLV
ncbi:MAG: NYN domain-containing protein [Planktothrix sp.]|uniref:NYN domain-containing protein n=1 Tax=Planktothrix sp. TaxID=3088171 RepID=UPI0038D3C37D